MILDCIGAVCTLTTSEPIASGAKNTFTADFTFDSAWDGLTKMAIFQNGDISEEVLLVADSGIIPSEVLASPGNLLVGVFGSLDGTKILTTNMLNVGRIEQGANVDIVLELLGI